MGSNTLVRTFCETENSSRRLHKKPYGAVHHSKLKISRYSARRQRGNSHDAAMRRLFSKRCKSRTATLL